MKLKDNKIVEATEIELYNYWLQQWSDMMSFPDYRSICIMRGTKVVESNEYRTKVK